LEKVRILVIDCLTGKEKKIFDRAYRAFWRKRGIKICKGGILKKKKGTKMVEVSYENNS